MTHKRIGFFSRILDDLPPAERFTAAVDQISLAERVGFDSAWIAQHHFNGAEGGMPSPLVFLAHVAATTSRISLGTGIITLALEQPVRVAEDLAVADVLSAGRLEVGFGSGGTPSSFPAFGFTFNDRRDIYARHLETVTRSLRGDGIGEERSTLYPVGQTLLGRLWEATFSAAGAAAAGRRGNGLLLSRTQPRPADNPQQSLYDIQQPIIDAYLDALPRSVAPRILASRTVFVAESRSEALRYAEAGLSRNPRNDAGARRDRAALSLDEQIRSADAHVGDVDDVLESFAADRILDSATEITFQVHSIDPPHELILRHIELLASRVAPTLGWGEHLHTPAASVAAR